MPRRIGVMGGTFDPVHLGHLRVAEEAVELLNLDRLLFIPAALPPHKAGAEILAYEHRWQMLLRAVSDNPVFGVSDIERRLPGKSFTVLTLRKLHEMHPEGIEIFFLVGLDAFLELDSWWHFKELFELANLAVLRRPGYREDNLIHFLTRKVSPLYARDASGGSFHHPHLLPVCFLDNTPLGISSTQVRRLAAAGRSIRYLVAHEVRSYITENNLYRQESFSTQ